MDKDGGNWTGQDIADWNRRLSETEPAPKRNVLRRAGKFFMDWLDRQGDAIAANGLSPYDYPRPHKSSADIVAKDEPEDNTWRTP